MVKRNRLIFIGGIHGVGKTTACTKLSLALGAIHVEAGKLISKHIRKNQTTKKVKDVNKNQDYLLLELEPLFKSKKWLIVDGHFTLIGSNNKIKKIPKRTFLKIKPSLIIVLTDRPNRIASRLRRRDKLDYNVETLYKMQELEKEHARSIADDLKVDYFEFPATSSNKLTSRTKRIISSII